MTFKVQDSLSCLYCCIEDLAHLAVTARDSFSSTQLIDLGLHVIINTNDYVRALEGWYNFPAGQTWLQFKLHFVNSRRTMHRVRTATMRDTSIQGAHQPSEDIQDVKTQVVGIENLQHTILGVIDKNTSTMNQMVLQ